MLRSNITGTISRNGARTQQQNRFRNRPRTFIHPQHLTRTLLGIRNSHEILSNIPSAPPNREALESARAEKKRQADLKLSRKFFNEVCAMLPNLNKTFEDMVCFNEKLCDNKISYFKEIGVELLAEKNSLEDERKDLLMKNSQYLSLVAEDRIDEYERLSTSLMQLRQDIGRRKEIVDTLERYLRDLRSIRKDIVSYSTGGSARKGKSGDYQAMMNSFNGFFTPLAQKINNENPTLVYSPDTNRFPMSISEISGSSTGTRKSLIAALTLLISNSR